MTPHHHIKVLVLWGHIECEFLIPTRILYNDTVYQYRQPMGISLSLYTQALAVSTVILAGIVHKLALLQPGLQI